jgi:predicted Zn-dependent peptidase
MILSGGATDAIVRLIDQTICQPMHQGKAHAPAWPEVQAPASGRFQQALEPSVQTAIRLGCRAPTRHHTDYPGLFVLNTILGGYFGSRLMANIREEKGYTYNIYSSLDSMRFDAYLYIGTEVGHEHVEATRREIRYELETLRKKPISGEELQMVKNYIMGSFLTLLDGPFQTADLIKGLLMEDVPLAAFSQWVEGIGNTTPGSLQKLAGTYLDPDRMWEVIIGKTT